MLIISVVFLVITSQSLVAEIQPTNSTAASSITEGNDKVTTEITSTTQTTVIGSKSSYTESKSITPEVTTEITSTTQTTVIGSKSSYTESISITPESTSKTPVSTDREKMDAYDVDMDEFKQHWWKKKWRRNWIKNWYRREELKKTTKSIFSIPRHLPSVPANQSSH